MSTPIESVAAGAEPDMPQDASVTVDSRFRPRRGGPPPERDQDGSIRLRGELEWRFEGTAAEAAALENALPSMAERLTDTLVLLSFGNAVGVFEVPEVGRLEVYSRKWGETDFERMLADLTEEAMALPFSSGDTAALPYDRSVAVHEDVLYHAFVYLRHVLLRRAPVGRCLLPALNLVLRDPHRRFERTTRLVPTEQVRRIDPRGLVRLASARDGIYPAPATLAHLAIVRLLRGHLPERVEESVVTSSYDTAENRFVKTLLARVLVTIARMRNRLAGRNDAFSNRIRLDCDRMERLVRPVAQHGFWQQIGPMIHLPAGSTVLQRRRGYRELYEHWVRLHLATRLPLSRERFHDLLEIKDIAALYELWCFFALVREVGILLGPPRSARRYEVQPMQLHVPWELEVRWPDGTALFYNRSFSRSSSAWHSYSVGLRPDIALQVPTGRNEELHLLDAKFRVDPIIPLLSDAEDAEDAAAEWQGVFKRADLYKMHTYRDAIPKARSVWILYPGTEYRFFPAPMHESPSEGALPQVVEGVGAIPFLPDAADHSACQEVLLRLLGRSE